MIVTCESPALEWEPVPPGSIVLCAADFIDTLVNWHHQRRNYAATVRVRVKRSPGYEYECTIAGQTGIKSVVWPKTAGITVMDGSVQWTCRALSTGSLMATISGIPTWEVPTGYSVASEAFSDNVASALITVPGTADGDDAEITITPTRSDTQDIPYLIILPVRIPERKVCCP